MGEINYTTESKKRSASIAVYLAGNKTPFENLTLISVGRVRTEELDQAEQDLLQQEIPPKIQVCLLTTFGVIGVGLLVGAHLEPE